MTTVVASDPQTEAIVNRLADNPDGILVGRGAKPTGAGWQGKPGQSPFKGYIVVHPIEGGGADGPVADPQADTRWVWQATCVGATAEQAERVADTAHERLVTATTADLAIPGRALAGPVTRETRGAPIPDRSLGDDHVLFMATPRFRVWTTPTT